MSQAQLAVENVPSEIDRVFEEGCRALAGAPPGTPYNATLTIVLSIPEEIAHEVSREIDRLAPLLAAHA